MTTLRCPSSPAIAEKRDMILHSCPPFVYCWPLILMGYGLWIASAFGAISLPSLASPVYYSVLVLVVLAIGVPLNLWQSAFVILAVVCSWTNIPLFSTAFGLFFYHSGRVDPAFAWEVSNGLLLVYLFVLGYLWGNNYRITSAAIVEHRFGARDVATARIGKQLRAEYPSVLKVILGCGAGDLLVRDTNGDRVLLRIPDVPFLYFRFDQLERKLKAYPTNEDDDEI